MGIGPGPQLEPGIGILAFSGGVGQPNVPIGQIPFAQDRRSVATDATAPAANNDVRNIAFNQNGDAVIVRTRDSDGNVRFSASSAGSPMGGFQTTVTGANTGLAVVPGSLNDVAGNLGWQATSSTTQTVLWPDQGGDGLVLAINDIVFVGYNADGEPTITTTGTDLQAIAVQASYSAAMTYDGGTGLSTITEWSDTLSTTEATVQEGSNAADQIGFGITFSVSDGLTIGASYIPQDAIVPSFTPAGAFNPATVTATQTASFDFGEMGSFSASYETKGNTDGQSQNAHWEVGSVAVSVGPDPGYGIGFMMGSYGQDDSDDAATVMAVYSMGGETEREYNTFTAVDVGAAGVASANTNIDGTIAKLTLIL